MCLTSGNPPKSLQTRGLFSSRLMTSQNATHGVSRFTTPHESIYFATISYKKNGCHLHRQQPTLWFKAYKISFCVQRYKKSQNEAKPLPFFLITFVILLYFAEWFRFLFVPFRVFLDKPEIDNDQDNNYWYRPDSKCQCGKEETPCVFC